ncbi:MAG TPA: hypothetical protein VMQ76_13385 [Terracidiphilus sp.]|jgi:hypothetical protein|nr:hypothetical protein [Terracidiphilus sp.]
MSNPFNNPDNPEDEPLPPARTPSIEKIVFPDIPPDMDRFNGKMVHFERWANAQDDPTALLSVIMFASHAHLRQLDKGGDPYLWHVLRVGISLLPDVDAAILGLLHDVREDTTASEQEILAALGDRSWLYPVLGALTRYDQPYNQYIRACAAHPIAARVKIADLRDNLDPLRLDKVGHRFGAKKAFALQQKYRNALKFLLGNGDF